MNRERLKRLADYLRTVDDAKFYMPHWAILDNKRCLTVACAFGHATALWPDELGIADNIISRPTLEVSRKWGDGCRIAGGVFLRNNEYEETGFEAAEVFFELTAEQSRFVFGETSYGCDPEDITPNMVADRIDLILKQEVRDAGHTTEG